MLPYLGRALTELGEWKRARTVLNEAVESSRARGEEAAAADAAITLAFLDLHTNAESSHAQVHKQIDAAIPVFERTGHDAGLARAWSLGGMLRMFRGDTEEAVVELERAARRAGEAGDRLQEMESLQYVLLSMLTGAASVQSMLDYVDELEARGDAAPGLRLTFLVVLAKERRCKGVWRTHAA